MNNNKINTIEVEYNYLLNAYGTCMSVSNVMNELKCGKDRGYELFKQKSFPSFELEGRKLIETRKFVEWLDTLPKCIGGYKLSMAS